MENLSHGTEAYQCLFSVNTGEKQLSRPLSRPIFAEIRILGEQNAETNHQN